MAIAGTSILTFPKLDVPKAAPHPESSAKAKRSYVCNVCSRAFRRNEHCVRHQRGHTQEKPFACALCRRRYSRRDLLVRHERTIHAAAQKSAATESQSIEIETSSRPSHLSDAENPGDDLGKARRRATTRPGPVPGQVVSGDSAISGQPTHREINLQSPSSSRTSDIMEATTFNPLNGQDNPTSGTETLAPGSNSANNLGVLAGDMSGMHTLLDDAAHLPSLGADAQFSFDLLDPHLSFPEDFEDVACSPFQQSWRHSFALQDSGNRNQSSSAHAKNLQHTFERADFHLPAGQNPMAVQGFHKPLDKLTPVSTDTSESQRMSSGPRITRLPDAKPPEIVFNDDTRACLMEDLMTRYSAPDLSAFTIPKASVIQKCLQTYAEAFDVHLPLFHFPTMDLARTPWPLTLAITAIGALYRLSRRLAASLYQLAEDGIASELALSSIQDKSPRFLEDWTRPVQEGQTSYQDKLWLRQASLLLTFFGCFSGDPRLVARTIRRLSDCLVDYRQLAPSVKPEDDACEHLSWHEWVHRESLKRLLYSFVQFNNILTIAYGIPAGFSIMSDGYIEMPADQGLWDAPTAEDWSALALRKPKAPRLSLRNAVSTLMHGKMATSPPEEAWLWSPYACNVVVTAVSNQVWHTMQGSTFTYEDGMQQYQEEYQRRNRSMAEAVILQCRNLITEAPTDVDYPRTDKEGPLLFNSLAILRANYCRTSGLTGSMDGSLLLLERKQDILKALDEFTMAPVHRDESVTKVIDRALESVVIASKEGSLLVRKTAAFTWSIEHAVTGWDMDLAISRWVFALERVQRDGGMLDEFETRTMGNITGFMADAEDEYPNSDSKCLAASVARYRANFYDDPWVWGITPRIAWMLRELANSYERAWLRPEQTDR